MFVANLMRPGSLAARRRKGPVRGKKLAAYLGPYDPRSGPRGGTGPYTNDPYAQPAYLPPPQPTVCQSLPWLQVDRSFPTSTFCACNPPLQAEDLERREAEWGAWESREEVEERERRARAQAEFDRRLAEDRSGFRARCASAAALPACCAGRRP